MVYLIGYTPFLNTIVQLDAGVWQTITTSCNIAFNNIFDIVHISTFPTYQFPRIEFDAVYIMDAVFGEFFVNRALCTTPGMMLLKSKCKNLILNVESTNVGSYSYVFNNMYYTVDLAALLNIPMSYYLDAAYRREFDIFGNLDTQQIDLCSESTHRITCTVHDVRKDIHALIQNQMQSTLPLLFFRHVILFISEIILNVMSKHIDDKTPLSWQVFNKYLHRKL